MEAQKIKKPNAWIAHVRKYADEKKIPYTQAVGEAKATYTKVVKPPRKSPALLPPPPLVRQVAQEAVVAPKVKKPRKPKPVSV